MRYLKQLLIILIVSFLGEILKFLLPFPIPASIYGMVLMLLLLLTGVIKINQVKETSRLLIEIMPVMFVPSAVGLITSWNTLVDIIFPALVITVVVIVTVIFATGWVSQIIIRRNNKNNE